MIQFSSPIAGCMRWGKWGANFSTTEYLNMIEVCMQHGITSFDHADIYGDYTTEEEFGNALKLRPELRLQIQLISKCGIQMVTSNKSHQIKSYNTSKKHIIQSTENSLKNFGTDYLDVLLIHRPDPLLHPEEVADAIAHLKQQGKIKHFGVSNFLPHQVNVLNKFVKIEYNQIEISILRLNSFLDGSLDNCMEHNIIPMAWAPLGGGILNDDAHPRFRSITTIAAELAEKYGSGINEILVAFLTAHPSKIIPIVGTTKLERLLQAKQATTIQLAREDWFKLWIASTGEDVP
ncbi:MAG: aldo/keto reductase [Sphingobacteriia bacterium]|nr:aldo/keto reductase [Sphingobacteriia bacterium]